jgi:hypothetical protein
MALTALTDAYGKGPDHAERMRGCARIVQCDALDLEWYAVHGLLWF